jgi:peptidoglycan/xylan/chitin deacetylase (PgdA/CDA1 family)
MRTRYAVAGLALVGIVFVPFTPKTSPVTAASTSVTPLHNNASAGKVVFTFDDGPTANTEALIARLRALHIPAIVFNIGIRAQADPAAVRAEVRAGLIVGNHTWDHPSLTGASTGMPPLTMAQVNSELVQATNALVAAGAPKPTLYRPPYGDVNIADNNVAVGLGLRLVAPWGTPDSGIVDSQDWTAGATADTITQNVEQGYTSKWLAGPAQWPGIHGGSIISMHDGPNWPADKAALQSIVIYMNDYHLGATTKLPADTTGGLLQPWNQ